MVSLEITFQELGLPPPNFKPFLLAALIQAVKASIQKNLLGVFLRKGILNFLVSLVIVTVLTAFIYLIISFYSQSKMWSVIV